MNRIRRHLARTFLEPAQRARRHYGPRGFWTRLAFSSAVALALGVALAAWIVRRL